MGFRLVSVFDTYHDSTAGSKKAKRHISTRGKRDSMGRALARITVT
jgi:hypothetical protein